MFSSTMDTTRALCYQLPCTTTPSQHALFVANNTKYVTTAASYGRVLFSNGCVYKSYHFLHTFRGKS